MVSECLKIFICSPEQVSSNKLDFPCHSSNAAFMIFSHLLFLGFSYYQQYDDDEEEESDYVVSFLFLFSFVSIIKFSHFDVMKNNFNFMDMPLIQEMSATKNFQIIAAILFCPKT